MLDVYEERAHEAMKPGVGELRCVRRGRAAYYQIIAKVGTVTAGLDYAAVGPEHSYLRDVRRVEYTYATDAEALQAFRTMSETEGIIPALDRSRDD